MQILLLNYPNNPTSATADEAFFLRAIAFCKAHGLLLIHDAPYVDQVGKGRGSLTGTGAGYNVAGSGSVGSKARKVMETSRGWKYGNVEMLWRGSMKTRP